MSTGDEKAQSLAFLPGQRSSGAATGYTPKAREESI